MEAAFYGTLPVSLCMIVRNEERFLPQCLASAAPFCSEIIIVDTGSTDQTAAIAEAFGAKVLTICWQDHFAEARNIALEQASQPWILVLDADERLVPLPIATWEQLLAEESCYGYLVQIRSRVDGRSGDEEISDAVCRLFRNDPRIRFTGALHEEAASAVAAYGSEALREAPVQLLHEGHRNVVMMQRRKKERNERILLAALSRDPDNPVLRYAMGTEYFTYGSWERAVLWLEPLLRGVDEEAEEGHISDVYLKLIHALRALGRLKEAEQWAVCGLRKFGDFPDLHEAYAAVLLETDRTGEAEEALYVALAVGSAPMHYSSALGSGTYRALFMTGYVSERKYDWLKAADYYAAALAIKLDYRLGEAADARYNGREFKGALAGCC
ncbi:glycosyltransferase [Paenibacillus sp. YAF4_2]|uniref:glycosyltransferase family 2 protein n=1 Tax=Paenibacillus sp. YAF4_2 TaxID=3233085 RepID=UPI003F968BFF